MLSDRIAALYLAAAKLLDEGYPMEHPVQIAIRNEIQTQLMEA